ncbi:hypothetical protein [Pseudoalteromonas sp. SG44-1]|nr:hypothetical protein [Pseudoalteromonas sp. SG44-1]
MNPLRYKNQYSLIVDALQNKDALSESQVIASINRLKQARLSCSN